MMTKKQHVEYWINTAEKDWASVDILFVGRQYLQSLFWAHLVLEKLAKALWVKNNEENIPPKIHNLVVLLKQANVDLGEEKMNFVKKFNEFQLSGRYPDYTNNLYKRCTEEFTYEQLEKTKEIRICLLNLL